MGGQGYGLGGGVGVGSGAPPLPDEEIPLLVARAGTATGLGRPGESFAGEVGEWPERDAGVVSRERLQAMMREVDGRAELTEEAEDVLLEIVDDFVTSVTEMGCMLAKHRGGDALEAKDLQYHLRRHWGIDIPGVGDGAVRTHRPPAVASAAHNRRMAAVREARYASAAPVPAIAPAADRAAAAPPGEKAGKDAARPAADKTVAGTKRPASKR